MSKSYRKPIRWNPAHARRDQNLKRYDRKVFGNWLKALRDGEGIPILPRGWGMSGRRWFGGRSYVRWGYQFWIVGGRLVSTSGSPDPHPGYEQRRLRHYQSK